jgi:dCMP deaminase
MDLAKHIAGWSKDPSTKIGAVVVNPSTKHVVSLGYNGFPRGFADDERLGHRPTKYPRTVHAEMNAIYNAVYNGVGLLGTHLYVCGLPVCDACSLGIIQVGIKRVVIDEKTIAAADNQMWVEMWQRTKENFAEANVEIEYI